MAARTNEVSAQIGGLSVNPAKEAPEPRAGKSLDESGQLRVDQIVLEAAGLETAARVAYLDELHTSSPELLAEARRVLAAALEISEDFLAAPARDLLQDSAPPRSDERYVIGDRLGVGGMASVYAAEDLQLQRNVALKVLHFTDAGALGRCLREARAQARVRHPHVLDVHETGEIDGHPFIALRHVEGVTLEKAAQDLSLEAKVALLIQVAEGLAAAHRLGLVHQDVKPSNILVEEKEDGALHAWVSDFGLAAALHGSAPTQGGDGESLGGLEGTAAYLAPERLAPIRGSSKAELLPVDRRVDIFAFGVTLYRLLTGRLPFDAPLVPDLFRQILGEEPPRPSLLVPTLPSDLEAIILRCLAKDPNERYASADAVAEDLRRFLRGEVVEAHAAGLVYRLTKFTLRHRKLLSAAAVIALVLFSALTVAGISGLIASRAHQNSALRQNQAEGLIDFMLSDLREKLDELGRLELLDAVGDEAMAYFASVPEEKLSEEELARRSKALYQIGSLRLRRGQVDLALESFEASLTSAQALSERHPESAPRLFELGQSHFWLGFARREKGETQPARLHFEAYLDISRRLTAREPGNGEWMLELAYAESNLGTLENDLGRFEGALEHHRRSLEIRQELFERSPDSPRVRQRLATAHNALGGVLDALSQVEEAQHHYEAQLKLAKSLAGQAPGNVHLENAVAVAHNYLGGLRLRLGRWPQALEHFSAATAIYQRLAEGDPTDPEWRFRHALNLARRGHAKIAIDEPGDFAEGLANLRGYQKIILDLSSSPSTPEAWRREVALSHLSLAQALGSKPGTDPTEALDHVARAIELLESMLDAAPADPHLPSQLASALLLHGSMAQDAGQTARARRARERALDLLAPFEPIDAGYRGQAIRVQALLDLGRGTEAKPAIKRLRDLGFCAPYFSAFCSRASDDQEAGSGP